MTTTLNNIPNPEAGTGVNGNCSKGVTTLGRDHSRKSNSSSSQKRIQLEIFAKESVITEAVAETSCEATHDSIQPLVSAAVPTSPPSAKTPRFWSAASSAWKRVEKARLAGEATVIPQSANPSLEVALDEDSQESVWKDPLFQIAGLISFVVIFLSGI